VSLCCTVGSKWVTEMDGVKFEFNDIQKYTKNDLSEDSLSAYNITKYEGIFYDIIEVKVIHFSIRH